MHGGTNYTVKAESEDVVGRNQVFPGAVYRIIQIQWVTACSLTFVKWRLGEEWEKSFGVSLWAEADFASDYMGLVQTAIDGF
jgi:hypothetical protein